MACKGLEEGKCQEHRLISLEEERGAPAVSLVSVAEVKTGMDADLSVIGEWRVEHDHTYNGKVLFQD